MRSSIVVLALALLLSGAAFSEGMTLGFTGGLNLANVTGDAVEDNEIKLCFGGGAFLNIPLSELFSFQPELLYMMKGVKFGDNTSPDSDVGVRLSYIDIPLLAKFSIPTQGCVTPSFFAGPYVGFLLSAEAYMGDDVSDIADSTKSTDLGLVFGGGVDYALGEGNLIFDVRYALGLSTIDGSTVEEDVKNTGIIFKLGYGFDI
jgi:hypothetical protein